MASSSNNSINSGENLYQNYLMMAKKEKVFVFTVKESTNH
jgi:hypothetical protein